MRFLDRVRAKRLHLPGGAGGPWRHVVIAGLGLTIVIAGGLGIRTLLRGSRPGPAASTSQEAGTPHVCLQCRHQFLMTADDFRKFMESLDPKGSGDSLLVHCPKCGARHSGYPMARCPKCGKPYVPHGIEITAKIVRGEPVPSDLPDVCPHCNSDIAAYWKSRSRRGQRQ